MTLVSKKHKFRGCEILSKKTANAADDLQVGRFSIKPKRALLVILAISFALKFAVWLNVLSSDAILFCWADSKSYHDTAVALHRLGDFSFSVEHPEIPQTYRTPGYPVFLAAVYAIFGESWPAAIMVQIFISLLTILLTYHIAGKFWNAKVALIAALIVALDPISFTYSLKIMTETLFAFFIVAMIASGLLFLRSQGGVAGALMAGLFLSFATLTRPLSYYLVVPIAVGFLVAGIIQRWTWRKVVLGVILLTLPTVFFVGAWKWRNYRLTHSSVYTCLEGFYAYFWQAAAVVAARDGISLEKAQAKLGMLRGESYDRWRGYCDLHPETAGLTVEQISERWDKEGKHIIKQHPLLFARVYLSGIVRMLSRPGIQQLLEMMGFRGGSESLTVLRQYPLLLLPMLFSMLFLLFLYSGVLLFFWFRRRVGSLTVEHLFVLGVLLYIIVFSGGPSAISRFRIPLIPLLAIFAAKGYFQLPLQRPARG